MAIFSDWIVLLIMLHLDRKVIFSDGALAPFRFCDANIMFAFSFFLFDTLHMHEIPCISGLPPSVGQVD